MPPFLFVHYFLCLKEIHFKMEWNNVLWGLGGSVIGYLIHFYLPRTLGINIFISNVELINENYGNRPGDMFIYTYRATLTIFNNTAALKRIEIKKIKFKSFSWQECYKTSMFEYYDIEPTKKSDSEIRFYVSFLELKKIRLFYHVAGIPINIRRTFNIKTIYKNLNHDSIFVDESDL